MDKKLTAPLLYREFQLPDVVLRKDAGRTMMTFSGSSEYPVERWFGTEVLSHDPKAVRLDRANKGAMPLLFGHDRMDPVGMVTAGRVADGKTLFDAAFFETERGKEVAMMVEGGLRNISLGYRLHTLEEGKKSDIFTATDWEPFEASIEPTPADPTIGVGRDAGQQFEVRMIRPSDPAQAAQPKGNDMAEGNAAAGQTSADEGTISMGVDHSAMERARMKGLQALGRAHSIPADVVEKWIDDGTTGDEAAHACLQVIAERAKKTVKDNPSNLGLSQAEVRSYSITRAIKACVEKNWAVGAPYEAEISKAVAARMGKQGGEHSFFVPLDVQWANNNLRLLGKRDLIVGSGNTGTDGGYLVGTSVQSFIDILRNRSVCMQLGATTMPGLVGSVTIPKLTGDATGYWFGDETGTATESNLTFGQLALTPKTVSAYVEISRQLLLQSTPNAEGIVNTSLARVVALKVDAAGLAGPGTAGEPQGLVGLTGLGTAHPATGTAIGYKDMIGFQVEVASSNAMLPGFAYVTTPEVAGILMAKPRFTNSDTPIWGGNILDGTLVGARAMTSLQMGTGSMFGGDFSQMVIGEWGVLEVEANPYAQFQAGIVGVRALYTVDIGIRYPGAFALGTGMTG